MAREICHINQCDVCWKTDTHLTDVTLNTRRGIRTYLLCDECYEVYKNMWEVVKHD